MDEDESRSGTPNLNSPDSGTISSSSSTQFLTVDETKRPRANSDPVGLHLIIANLPQITVTDNDDDDDGYKDSADGRETSFAMIGRHPQRPRSNTCPEDLFKLRRTRPPTPPPSDIMKSSGGGKKKFTFNFNHTKELSGISFTHHRLCKVNEDGGMFITKSNQNVRPSHAARRASCLAALSESSTTGDELKEEDEEIDASSALRPGSGARRQSDSFGMATSRSSALSSLKSSFANDFRKCNLCSGQGEKPSVIVSDTADLVDISVPSSKLVNSTTCSKENNMDKSDRSGLQAC